MSDEAGLKTSKINNSEEELIEDKQNNIEMKLPTSISQKQDRIRIDNNDLIVNSQESKPNSNIFRGKNKYRVSQLKNKLEKQKTLESSESSKDFSLKKDKNENISNQIPNEENRELMISQISWKGDVYFYLNGNIIMGPCSFRPTLLSLCSISVPVFLFLGFNSSFLSERISAIVPIIIFILYVITSLLLIIAAFSDPGIMLRFPLKNNILI